MGRSYTPKYTAVVDGRDSAWDTKRHGAPTNANAEKYAMSYAKSLNPGEVNEHIRDRNGCIPYPRCVRVRINRLDGMTVAEWRAGMFQVYPS